MYYRDRMDAGGWIFMALVGVVLLGLLLAFVVWLVQEQRRRPHRDHYLSRAPAREILGRRLASGEISVEEYERLRASLDAPAPAPASPGEPPGPSSA